MEKKNYLLVKNRFNKEIVYINYDQASGFKFNPINRKEGSISVNQMVIINPTFIEKVLTRKTKRKLELYLQYIVELLDEESDTDITGLRSALNDITRYKDIVMHKYRLYLDERYFELYMKKLSLLEYELKMKILHYKDNIIDSKIKEEFFEEKVKEEIVEEKKEEPKEEIVQTTANEELEKSIAEQIEKERIRREIEYLKEQERLLKGEEEVKEETRRR